MIKNWYQVGKPFREENPFPGEPNYGVRFTRDFFFIVYFINEYDEDDLNTWMDGDACYGVFSKGGIPFFLLQFPPYDWLLRAYINIFTIQSMDLRVDWLNASGRRVVFCAVDATTNILLAARAIDMVPSVADMIRSVAEEQQRIYLRADEVTHGASDLLQRVSQQEMIGLSRMIAADIAGETKEDEEILEVDETPWNAEGCASPMLYRYFGRQFPNARSVPYPGQLPAPFLPWHCYLEKLGHCILVLIEGRYDECSANLIKWLVPCPVKAAVRGYRLFKTIPVVDLKFSPSKGVRCLKDDYEY